MAKITKANILLFLSFSNKYHFGETVWRVEIKYTVLNTVHFITAMKISFLTCQDRGIYPSAAPPTRLGNEKLPVNLYQGKWKKSG